MKRIVKHRLLSSIPILVCVGSIFLLYHIYTIIKSIPQVVKNPIFFWGLVGMFLLIDILIIYLYAKEILKTESDFRNEDKKRLEERIESLKTAIKNYQNAIPILEKKLEDYKN